MTLGPSSKQISVEDIWDSLVKAVKLSQLDLEEDPYFVGVFEGQLYSLSIIADVIGKEKEYSSLCREIDLQQAQ